jgi:membrane protease YdiL (CAAX protease family)
MLALATTAPENGLASLAFAVITVAAIFALSLLKKLPAHRATRRQVQLLAWVLTIVMWLTLPLALESFFRMWDPSYVYTGS